MKKFFLFFLCWVTFLPSIAIAEDIHEVAAEGVGVTEREAVTDAFRNAIEESIGLYVDSETRMKNEELISDEVLTASKGYIHKYRMLFSERENGLIKVKIKALVKMHDVKTRLKGLNISIIPAENMANTHARLASKYARSKDAEKVLKKTLDDFFSDESMFSMIDIKLNGYKILEDEMTQDKMVPFEVSFEIAVNNEVYTEKVNEIKRLFDGLGGIVVKTLSVVFDENGVAVFDENSNEIRKYRDKLYADNRLGMANNYDRKYRKMFFGLIRKVNSGFQLEHYAFPFEWKNIYPWNEEDGPAYNFGISNFMPLDVLIQFKNGEDVILSKKPSFVWDLITLFPRGEGKYEEGRYNQIIGFKSHWDESKIRRDWGGGANADPSHRIGGYNIAPMFFVTSDGRQKYKYIYRDKINVDLLYDIQKVEVKLEMNKKQ